MIQRDREINPNKYKIMCEMGLSEEEVFKMKKEDINEISERFMRQKGIEYLRENSLQVKVSQFNKKVKPK